MVMTASHDYSSNKNVFCIKKEKENHVICFQITVSHKIYMMKISDLSGSSGVGTFFWAGGAHLQGHRNPPTPKLMFLFGFGPLYFVKLKKLIIF